MKKCPFCTEEIQDEAIVCKHCKRDIEEQPAKKEEKPATERVDEMLAQREREKNREDRQKPNGSSTAGDQSPYKPWIEHLAGAWKAEEENARRNLERSKLLSTAVLAFFVVGLFRMGTQLLEPPTSDAGFVSSIMLGLGLAFMLGATPYVYRIPARWRWSLWSREITIDRTVKKFKLDDTKAASRILIPKRSELRQLKDLPRDSPERSWQDLFNTMLGAVGELSWRNHRRSVWLTVAFRRFYKGVICVALAVVIHFGQPLLDPPFQKLVIKPLEPYVGTYITTVFDWLGYTEEPNGDSETEADEGINAEETPLKEVGEEQPSDQEGSSETGS